MQQIIVFGPGMFPTQAEVERDQWNLKMSWKQILNIFLFCRGSRYNIHTGIAASAVLTEKKRKTGILTFINIFSLRTI